MFCHHVKPKASWQQRNLEPSFLLQGVPASCAKAPGHTILLRQPFTSSTLLYPVPCAPSKLLSPPAFCTQHPSILSTFLLPPAFSPHHPSILSTFLLPPPFSFHYPSGVKIQRMSRFGTDRVFEGSLEVKLPTIWTDEKQSRERQRERKIRRKKSRRERVRRKKMQMREKGRVEK